MTDNIERSYITFKDGLPIIKSVFIGDSRGVEFEDFRNAMKIANRLGLAERRITQIDIVKGETFIAEIHHVSVWHEEHPVDPPSASEPSPDSAQSDE